MKKSVKRFLSTILALTMLCSCMAVMNITAFATEAEAAAVGKSVDFDEKYTADLKNAENVEYTAAYTQAPQAKLSSNTSSQDKVYFPVSSSTVTSGKVTVSGKFTITKNNNWEFLGLANGNNKLGPCIRTADNVYTLRIDGDSSSNLTKEESTLGYDNAEHSFSITVNFDDTNDDDDVYVSLDVDGYTAEGYSSNMASGVSNLYISTPKTNNTGDRYVILSGVTATIGETTSDVTISSYSNSSSVAEGDFVYTNETKVPASVTLTSSSDSELLSTMPILDESGNAVTVDAGKLVISGSFDKTKNTGWSFIRLCDENGDVVTAIRTDTATDKADDDTGEYGTGKFILGHKNTSASGSTSVPTTIDNDAGDHTYVLTVDFDDTDASGNVKVSLDLDEADTVSYYTAISSVAYIELQTSKTPGRYVTLYDPTITAAGTKYYVIFTVSSDEADQYSSFDILNNGATALTGEETVYTGVVIGDDTITPDNEGDYVVGYRVRGAEGTDDFGTKFTMDLQ